MATLTKKQAEDERKAAEKAILLVLLNLENLTGRRIDEIEFLFAAPDDTYPEDKGLVGVTITMKENS